MKILPISITEPSIGRLIAGDLDHFRRPIGALSVLTPGDLLWLREPFRFAARWDHLSPSQAVDRGAHVHFAAGLATASVQSLGLGKLRMARALPRAAHRYHLLVTAVDRHPLQAITDAEMRADGYATRNAWVDAWDKSMKDFDRRQRWSDNPEILRIAFTLQRRPAPDTPNPPRLGRINQEQSNG